MERTMTGEVEFPAMRADVMDALASLSDRAHQDARWGVYDEAAGSYDDLTLNVNILYDCHVFPDPAEALGAAIRATEVDPLRTLFGRLEPMIADLGEAPDATYVADPRWSDVVSAAGEALATMRSDDRGAEQRTQP